MLTVNRTAQPHAAVLTCYLGIVVADLQVAADTHPSRLLINTDQAQLHNLHPARYLGDKPQSWEAIGYIGTLSQVNNAGEKGYGDGIRMCIKVNYRLAGLNVVKATSVNHNTGITYLGGS